MGYVRFWRSADMPIKPSMSAFGGKADMPFCAAHVLTQSGYQRHS